MAFGFLVLPKKFSGGEGGGNMVAAKTPTIKTVDTGYSTGLKWLQFPTDDGALAFGLAGDLFPRVIFMSDPSDQLFYWGDGTVDPTTNNGGIGMGADYSQVHIWGAGGLNVDGPITSDGGKPVIHANGGLGVGTILVYNGSLWQALAAGGDGQVLTMSGGTPHWV